MQIISKMCNFFTQFCKIVYDWYNFCKYLFFSHANAKFCIYSHFTKILQNFAHACYVYAHYSWTFLFFRSLNVVSPGSWKMTWGGFSNNRRWKILPGHRQPLGQLPDLPQPPRKRQPTTVNRFIVFQTDQIRLENSTTRNMKMVSFILTYLRSTFKDPAHAQRWACLCFKVTIRTLNQDTFVYLTVVYFDQPMGATLAGWSSLDCNVWSHSGLKESEQKEYHTLQSRLLLKCYFFAIFYSFDVGRKMLLLNAGSHPNGGEIQLKKHFDSNY